MTKTNANGTTKEHPSTTGWHPTITKAIEMVETIQANPAASYALKNALAAAMTRDPLDALADAETMVAVLKVWAREAEVGSA